MDMLPSHGRDYCKVSRFSLKLGNTSTSRIRLWRFWRLPACRILIVIVADIFFTFIIQNKTLFITYDHRLRNIGHPVRSAVLKDSDRLISSWVGDHQRIPTVVCFAFLALKSPEMREAAKLRYLMLSELYLVRPSLTYYPQY